MATKRRTSEPRQVEVWLGPEAYARMERAAKVSRRSCGQFCGVASVLSAEALLAQPPAAAKHRGRPRDLANKRNRDGSRVSVWLTATDYATIKRASELRGMSLSWFMAKAIEAATAEILGAK